MTSARSSQVPVAHPQAEGVGNGVIDAAASSGTYLQITGLPSEGMGKLVFE